MACLIILPAAISSIFFFIAGITAFIRKHSQRSLIPASMLAGAFSASVYVMVTKPYDFIGFIIAIITSIIALIIGSIMVFLGGDRTILRRNISFSVYTCGLFCTAFYYDGYLSPSLSREYTLSPAVGFVLAHPDDESMFFLPTLKVLKTLTDSRNKLKPQLHFLYLSNGDYKIDGSVRENEIAQLCKKYNYSCSVIDDSNLKDGTTQWDPEAALEYIKNFVSENNISVLFTFDDKGVSGHPNHIGTHHAVKLAAKTFKGVHVFYLESFNLVCKYSSFLSVFQLFFRR
ncbi:N-acetylglucosaminylphosphatidylinositol deacetylase [Theileria orientalis]|uniref:N-acetylglucosaminylphosphatidylinositol deacetylase n=1 Tax=Theileria orientalis TaxID=68886 RepID=A0A976M787_THEOR|nr:N-acetylglucosaminylphosphatidylinositol deacetylase [Theileria orientalis]